MKYTEMNDSELAKEIIRVRNQMLSGKPHAYHQNKKYLSKLEAEWKKRHGEN